ncbi:phage tail domain-containing protein [Halobacillus litoralis]|uniref:phage tail domain-containing protein n=1 Tax=Halobacillus litoralis TaxID=45668 RepID=UPI001CD3658E|nr:phage tail domain-containing protein [Halobacillus litoralis]MCA1021656.1 phage tail family protein [Halobacillus litoralis]
MISESLYFTYDGINSKDVGLLNVSIDNGLFEEVLVSGRKIVEDKIDGLSRPYFKYIEHDPLEFEVHFYFEETYDTDKIRWVARWLTQDVYKEMSFSANPDKRFFCLTTSPINLTHNGLEQGYVSMTFRCNTHHAYTPYIQSTITEIQNEGIIEVDNIGDMDVKPVFILNKKGDGDVYVTNLSDGGRKFEIYDLNNKEEVRIDNALRRITSDQGNLKYSECNRTYLKLVYGKNRLKIEGDCDFRWECRFNLL